MVPEDDVTTEAGIESDTEGVEAESDTTGDEDSEEASTESLESETSAGAAEEGPASEVVGSSLHQALLPRTVPRVGGYDIAAGTATDEGAVGTTVWTPVSMAEGRVGVAALDVRAADPPAVLELAIAGAFLRELARGKSLVAETLAAVNEALGRSGLESASHTVECGLLAVGAEGVEWGSAGHTLAGVLRRGGTFEELPSHGPPLGILRGFRYGGTAVKLGPGDEVVVITKASLGLFRGAADLVASLHGKPAGEVVSMVHKAIRKAQLDAPVETTVLFLRKV